MLRGRSRIFPGLSYRRSRYETIRLPREDRIAQMCDLAKRYGAAVVAGTIDEDKLNAMARTRERKLSIAQRIRDRHGLPTTTLLVDRDGRLAAS